MQYSIWKTCKLKLNASTLQEDSHHFSKKTSLTADIQNKTDTKKLNTFSNCSFDISVLTLQL